MEEAIMQFEQEFDFEPTTESDFERKANHVKKYFHRKVGTLDRTLRFVSDLLALFRYMSDPNVHLGKKVVVVAALLYFIFPFDSIPDILPLVGFLDDIGIVAGTVKFMAGELEPYYGQQSDYSHEFKN